MEPLLELWISWSGPFFWASTKQKIENSSTLTNKCTSQAIIRVTCTLTLSPSRSPCYCSKAVTVGLLPRSQSHEFFSSSSSSDRSQRAKYSQQPSEKDYSHFPLFWNISILTWNGFHFKSLLLSKEYIEKLLPTLINCITSAGTRLRTVNSMMAPNL